MRIGIDFISALGRGGNGVYTSQLVQGLSHLDSDNTYYLYTRVRKKYRQIRPVMRGNFIYKAIYLHHLTFGDLLEGFCKGLNDRILSLSLKSDPVEIFHCTNPVNFPKIPLENAVVTIHDLAYLRRNKWVSDGSIRFYEENIERILRSSMAIIADSQSTKDDILDNFSVSEEKVKVVPLAASEVFRPLEPDRSLIHNKGLFKDYVLYVGDLQPRKNLRHLLEAYAMLPLRLKDNFDITFVGNPRNEESLNELKSSVDDLGIEKNVKLLGYVDLQSLVNIYNGASLFVYPSLLEGFGIPVLEALSCGLPTITSNVSSMPEVVGDAAILIDPYSVEEIAQAMESLLYNESLKEEYTKRALKRAKLFSWEKTARETLNVYRESSKV